MAADDLLQSVYRFHVYYQIRRILVEIQAPLPQDQAWDAVNNPYDRRGYERICNEFGVSPHSDWEVSGPNQGLGRVYNYWTNNGYHPVGDGEYDSSRMSFTKQTTNSLLHVDFIKQDAAGADKAWRRLILDTSDGFTRPGVERLNDSIRTYVWAILGAQAQTRTGILGTGTAFDVQKQFLANIEDAISSPVDLPSAISRYQDVLQYARSEVNFSFGVSLYMAPSNMLLRVGNVAGYDNLIIVATGAQSLGMNSGLNTVDAPPDATNDTGEVAAGRAGAAARKAKQAHLLEELRKVKESMQSPKDTPCAPLHSNKEDVAAPPPCWQEKDKTAAPALHTASSITPWIIGVAAGLGLTYWATSQRAPARPAANPPVLPPTKSVTPLVLSLDGSAQQLKVAHNPFYME